MWGVRGDVVNRVWETQCKSVHLAADGVSCTLEENKNGLIVNCCIQLGRVCTGLYCSLCTNPHQMLCAETTLDQWHCGNDTETWDSMQVSAPGCRWDEL